MGEAKRRARVLAEWQSGLSENEKVVADVTTAVLDRFVVPLRATGMCYRLAFFLTELLAERSVWVEPVVGYVNDGSGEIMISHAWIEMNGRRVDLSLAFTEHPSVQLQGEVVILDRIVRPGAKYSYHREQSPGALAELAAIQAQPNYAALVARKDAEHAHMVELSQSSERRRAYLDAAPDGFDFARMAAMVSDSPA